MRELASASTLPHPMPKRSAEATAAHDQAVLARVFGGKATARTDDGERPDAGGNAAHAAIGRAIELHAAGGEPPEWVHLVPAGEFSGADGRGPYRVDDPAALIVASMADGPLPVDENHSTDLARGHAARAQGWIVELVARADGVWGRVEWTEAGKALLADRAYRAVSPALVSEGERPAIVRRIARAALVNDPNLPLARFG